MGDLCIIIVTFQEGTCVRTMDTFNETLTEIYDWALHRVQVLSETYDVECLDNAMAIHTEFKEWFDPESDYHDICSLAYIGEGSEYAE